MSRERETTHFFDWVEKTKGQIEIIEPQNFRRILLLCLMDTLANCAFPNEKRQGLRFVMLIDEYSNWSHKDRVSLIHLKHLLDESNPPECSELKGEISRQLLDWPPTGFGSIPWSKDRDPLAKDLVGLCGGKCDKLIEKARYPSLLLEMRHFAVHEFRNVGQSLPDEHDFQEPYYSAFEYIETRQRSWELNIPTAVISNLVKSCSDELRIYFEKLDMSPFDSFSSKLNWHRDALSKRGSLAKRDKSE